MTRTLPLLIALLALMLLGYASTVFWPHIDRLDPPGPFEAALFAAFGLVLLALSVRGIRLASDDRANQQQLEQEQQVVAELEKAGVFTDLERTTRRPLVALKPQSGEPGALASKFGGDFYAPPGFVWPTVAGRPMAPLAQLNFAELPQLDGFPHSGILQFFVRVQEQRYGNYPEQGEAKNFRVVFHPAIDQPSLPNPDFSGAKLPFDKGLRLFGKADSAPMPFDDPGYQDAFVASWQRTLGRTDRPDPALFDAVIGFGPHPEEPESVHHFGGYPGFRTDDPRVDYPELAGHSSVLLSLDPYGLPNFGDADVACFMIEPERLAHGDFSSVLLHWCCF